MKSYLHFQKFGSGTKTLILFHGFGQDHRAFTSLLPELSERFTIYSFDLYYHGSSKRHNRTLSKTEWTADLESFLENEQIARFTLLAFSLGGRFAIATLVAFPTRVEQLILIAPDGIFRNPWFRFSTSRIGNPLFKHLMLRPEKFDRWLTVFNQYNLAPSAMIKFARRELQNRANLLKVYRSWTYFKTLQHHPKNLKNTLEAHKIPFDLVLGERDSIILPGKVIPKIRDISTLRIHLLDARHHELVEAFRGILNDVVKG